MAGKLRCKLLCEDRGHEQLFRPILERLFGRHRVRVELPGPTGGFTFVKERLREAAEYVRRRPQEAVGLLVVVDGDQAGLRDRLEEIYEVVRKVGFDAKRPDRIAVCIPSRRITR